MTNILIELGNEHRSFEPHLGLGRNLESRDLTEPPGSSCCNLGWLVEILEDCSKSVLVKLRKVVRCRDAFQGKLHVRMIGEAHVTHTFKEMS